MHNSAGPKINQTVIKMLETYSEHISSRAVRKNRNMVPTVPLNFKLIMKINGRPGLKK